LTVLKKENEGPTGKPQENDKAIRIGHRHIFIAGVVQRDDHVFGAEKSVSQPSLGFNVDM
jgi:hypothetical protein